MVINELRVPNPDRVEGFDDIPPETLRALEIIEPVLYGGPLMTVERAADLLRGMEGASHVLGARIDDREPLQGVAVVHRVSEGFWVQGLAIAPERQGEGMGTALMSSIEKLGRHQRVGEVSLRAIGDSAITYFEQLGYRASPSSIEGSIVIDMYKRIT